MSDSLPPQITVTQLPDGVRYSLPSRKYGRHAARVVGPTAAAMVGLPVLSFWLWAVAHEDHGPYPGIPVLFLACGGMMFVALLGLAGYSLWQLLNHSEIELRGGTLYGSERWGCLFWSWDRPVAGLRRFDVRDASRDDGSGRVYEDAGAATEFNVITPVWDLDAAADPEGPHLARGYPRAWLLPLANDLARRCRLAGDDAVTRDLRAAAPAIDVVEEPLPHPAGFMEQLDQPADSAILVEPVDDAVKLSVPASAGRFARICLVFRPGQLLVERRKPFAKPEQFAWSVRQLADIRVQRHVDSDGPDSFEVHIDPHPGEGKRIRIDVRNDAEGRWLATKLRQGLGMPEQPAAFLERDEQPTGSRLAIERSAQGVRIAVPPAGYAHPDVRRHFQSSVGALAGAGAASVFILFLLENVPPEELAFLQLLWLIPLCLLVLAIGFFMEGIKRAQRDALLAVIEDRLILLQTNLYGTRRQEWPRERVADIRVGDSHPNEHADPVWELQIHLKIGKTVGLLDGFGDAELQWIATVLRRALFA
jgi:hypothetical protein